MKPGKSDPSLPLGMTRMRLFVTKTGDRVLLRCPARWNDAEHEADGDGHAERHDDGHRGHDRIDVRDVLNGGTENSADEDAEDSAGEADHDRFAEELGEDISLCRPNSAPHADLLDA